MVGDQNYFPEHSSLKAFSRNGSLNRLKCYCNVSVTHICVITLIVNHFYKIVFLSHF